MLELICSTCGRRVQGDDSIGGQQVQCPNCNAQMMVPRADELQTTSIAAPAHAAQAKIATVPTMSDAGICEGTPPMPREPAPALTKQAPHFFLRALPYVIVAGVLLLALGLFGLLVPGVAKLRDAAARTQSVNNLKQIGLAMQSFHDTNKRIPLNGIAAGQKLTPPDSKITYFGNATTDCASSGSWLFQIVPYCDSQTIGHLGGVAGSDQIPEKYRNTGLQTFMCPGRGRHAWITDVGPWSDYHINVVLNAKTVDGNLIIGFDVPDVKRTLLGITDGSSNTIFAGHGYMNRDVYAETTSQGNFSSVIWIGGTEGTGRAFGVKAPKKLIDGFGPATKVIRDGWHDTTGITSATTPQPWGGPFAEGILVVMCDGTVRIVAYETRKISGRPDRFGAILTPDNDEN